MAFKDIINKGKDMISKGVGSIKKAAVDKRQAVQDFDLLKTRSDHIGPMSIYKENNLDPQAGKEQIILTDCLSINVENAKVVNRLIPIDETILDVKTGKEAKTEIEYALVITDRQLWVLNKNEYITYSFDNVINFEIVNKGMMTQGVEFNNNAWYIDGTENDVSRFKNVLTNSEARAEVIARKTAYLCGIKPLSQVLNMANRGVTFGENGRVVLHSGTENKLLNIQDIQSAQLLVNDTVALSRGREDSGNFVSSPMEARKMTVKIILAMGEFTIPILEQNMMNTTYRREDSTYITNYDFAKKLIDTLVNAMRGILPVKTPSPNVEQASTPEMVVPTQNSALENIAPAPAPVIETPMPPTMPAPTNAPRENPIDPFGIQSPTQEPKSPNKQETPQ